MIGKIQRVPLREVWKHEAKKFTPWLEENVDVLNEVLDISLCNVEREKEAGNFSVDLVAEDSMGNTVVIENQLEKSDHDHLGKLITYLTSIEAKVAIWIVSDPRPEHVKAITWLNESSAASFYLLKVEAIKIGGSEPAPLLTLIVGPSEESREAGKTKKDMAERYILRSEFWEQLLEHSKSKTKLHQSISPGKANWIGTGAGISGLNFNYSVTKHEASVELYIDRGKNSEEENKKVFDRLIALKEDVERAFGGTLSWERLDSKRASRVRKRITSGGYRNDKEEWPKIHEKMVDTMIRLEESLKPHIKKIKTRYFK